MMSALQSARLFLDSVPGWSRREATISELSGGLNNHSFLVESAGKRYVLRVTNDLDLSGFRDHELELKIQQLASRQGLAPEIVFSDPANGLMLSIYLPGRSLSPRDLRSRETLQMIASALRKLHRLPRCGVRFDARAAAELYLQALRQHADLPAYASICRDVIRQTPPPETWACCHNDLVAENIIDGERLRLIDFEYARDNDPLFDIVSLAGWHNMPQKDLLYLLEAYSGAATRERRERLLELQRQFDAIQWLWLAARQSLRPQSAQSRQMQRVQARLR